MSRSFFPNSDSWLANFEVCEALGREIMENISLRNQQQRNSKGYAQANVQARQLLKKFMEGKDKLIKMLISSRETLTAGEYERRERLLDSLTTRKLQIDAAFNRSDLGDNRDVLLGGNFAGTSSNVWGIEETDDTRDLTYEDLQKQKEFAIEEQDRGLDQLHSVVVQQKLMAQNINQELELHNEIIDDITDHADRTRERLIKETRHVTIVDRKSNTCGYWVMIIILLIAIIAVACVPSKH